MNKWIEFVLGIILIIASISCALYFLDWGKAAIHFLMGAVIIGVVLIGILLIVLGISEIKG